MLLGWYETRRCLLVDLPPEQAIEHAGEAFCELRPLAAELPASEASLLAYARALSLWRANHRHCSRCSGPMRSDRAGHLLHCAACGYQSFPRLDPAIIVLVHDGDSALLGRQAGWAPGRYSTIAGFVEPGESLEDAVRREVYEETGIAARDIAYHSSQPWPFPSSLMLGFTASGTVAPPVLIDGELEDARWFSRAELRSGAVGLPPPGVHLAAPDRQLAAAACRVVWARAAACCFWRWPRCRRAPTSPSTSTAWTATPSSTCSRA